VLLRNWKHILTIYLLVLLKISPHILIVHQKLIIKQIYHNFFHMRNGLPRKHRTWVFATNILKDLHSWFIPVSFRYDHVINEYENDDLVLLRWQTCEHHVLSNLSVLNEKLIPTHFYQSSFRRQLRIIQVQVSTFLELQVLSKLFNRGMRFFP
jgi:hypothetical protein